jgi:hypothetical protein
MVSVFLSAEQTWVKAWPCSQIDCGHFMLAALNLSQHILVNSLLYRGNEQGISAQNMTL